MYNYEVKIFYNAEGKYLDVRAGFVDPEFTGKVAKTVRQTLRGAQVTVALRNDGKPIYVRLQNAETIGELFFDAMVTCTTGRLPEKPVFDKIAVFCLKQMVHIASQHSQMQLEREFNLENINMLCAAS